MQTDNLEAEWRRAQHACEAASADIERLQGCSMANEGLIDVARIRLIRAEACRARIFAEMQKHSGLADTAILGSCGHATQAWRMKGVHVADSSAR